MKLELEDSVLKRAWVVMAWDERYRKACWELVERENFDDPTFYLGSGVYCVSGDNPATDRPRWLLIHDGKGEWCDYGDIAHLVRAGSGKAKRTRATKKAREYTLHICYRCEETFVSPEGTEPYRDLVDWTENNEPIYEPLCQGCAEIREWEKRNHSHRYYCGEKFWINQPRSRNCGICKGFMDGTLEYKAELDCGCGLCRENSNRPAEDFDVIANER